VRKGLVDRVGVDEANTVLVLGPRLDAVGEHRARPEAEIGCGGRDGGVLQRGRVRAGVEEREERLHEPEVGLVERDRALRGLINMSERIARRGEGRGVPECRRYSSIVRRRRR
jgi:hypothetical protein